MPLNTVKSSLHGDGLLEHQANFLLADLSHTHTQKKKIMQMNQSKDPRIKGSGWGVANDDAGPGCALFQLTLHPKVNVVTKCWTKKSHPLFIRTRNSADWHSDTRALSLKVPCSTHFHILYFSPWASSEIFQIKKKTSLENRVFSSLFTASH